MAIYFEHSLASSIETAHQVEVQSLEARRRASDVAQMLHCDTDTFTRLDGENTHVAHFSCQQGNRTLRLKAHLGNTPALHLGQDTGLFALACSAGYGPAVLAVPPSSGVIATRFESLEPLNAQALRDMTSDIVSLIWSVHHDMQAASTWTSSQVDAPKAAAHSSTMASPLSWLSPIAREQLQQKRAWLDAALQQSSPDLVFLNGSIRAGTIWREDDRLILSDWENARWGDPLEDLVALSNMFRASVAHSLALLDAYNGCGQTATTSTQQRRFLLLQAKSNLDAYVQAVDQLGPEHFDTRAQQMRMTQIETYLPDLPRIDVTTLPSESFAPALGVDDLAAGRHVALQLADAFLPVDTTLNEPIEQKDAFYFFRAASQSEDWFVKIRQSTPDQSRWLEPHWTAWAAEHRLAPEVHPYSGQFEYGNVLLTNWSGDGHLNANTIKRPEVFESVLRQMHVLHALPAPTGVMSEQPDEALSYTGGAWGRFKELTDRDLQTPIALGHMRDLLVQAEAELLSFNCKQTVCHRDLLPRNIFFVNGQARFVDWDWAGWGDPLSDVAKFLALGNVDYTKAESSLAIYFGRPATDQELRHLLLIALIMELDYYGANQYDLTPDHPGVHHRANRAFQLRDMLYPKL